MAIVTEVFSDPDNDRTIIKRTENFDGLTDTLKAMSTEGIHGHLDMRLMGVIPGILIEHYCTTRNITWAEFFNKDDRRHVNAILNDPDFAYFRVAPGRM
ncbi:hypothetical protein [Caballeronia sp. AZ1_KS37]|uniref:hypothetical protein n=1 Tax=Caballeronia sp. AZ1_KS37 TaxID=2921756 RepID=UPI00202875C6|nr:hypothetical protein [Caballeronia sp. AZ1_KS37]